MTAPIPTPSHRDYERALRGALARMTASHDVLPMLAAECETALDVDMCITAAFDAIATLLVRKVRDPEHYLTRWIALERELADQDGDANTA